MKLQNQVCNLELAKKLKSFGVPQLSLFYWQEDRLQTEKKYKSKLFKIKPFEIVSEKKNLLRFKNYSAFTSAELGEMLNPFLMDKKWHIIILYNGAEDCYVCDIIEFKKPKEIIYRTIKKTEADARAKMLVYLLKNGIIKL